MKMSTGLKLDIYKSLKRTIVLDANNVDGFVNTVNSSYDGIMEVLHVMNPELDERIQ